VRKFEKISLVEGMNQQNDMRSLASVSMSLSLSFVFVETLFRLAYQKLPDDADARPICSFAPVSGTYVTPIASNSVTRPLSSLS